MLKTYSKRMWLNKDDSPSTGSIAAYCGPMIFKVGEKQTAFFEVADCHNKIRLHVSPMDTKQEFIDKMKLLKSEIHLFIQFLEAEWLNDKTDCSNKDFDA